MTRHRKISGVWLILTTFIMVLSLSCGGDGDGGGGDGAATVPNSLTDTDNDGITDSAELTLFSTYGTNPYLADTDGDGMQDGVEFLNFDPNLPYRFNPLIADVPLIDIHITSAPKISLNYTLTDGTSQSISTERSSESTRSASVADTWSLMSSVESKTTHNISGTIAAEIKPGKIRDSSITISGTYAFGVERASGTEETFGWSKSQTQENKEALSRSESFESNHAITSSGGGLAVTVDVRNTGGLAFTLRNLYLGVAIPDPQNRHGFIPIGNLEFESSFGFPETTLYAGQRAELWTFKNNALYLDDIKSILDNYMGLVVKVSSYELLDADGRPFGFDYDTIGTRTATVIIDYGRSLPKERHLVATRGNPAGTTVTAGQAMQILGLRLSTEPSTELDVYSAGSFTWNGQSTSGLLGIRGINAYSAATATSASGSWVVVHVKRPTFSDLSNIVVYDLAETAEGSASLSAYAFADGIVLEAGDVLLLGYREDRDGDGLFEREEFLTGAGSETADADGDGLTDIDEITKYGTAPGNKDSDFDGLNDKADKQPTVADKYQVSAGAGHSLVIKTDGSIMAWGANANRQLGMTTIDDCIGVDDCQQTPTQLITTGTNWRDISAGYGHTIAISADLSLSGWGLNTEGQIGAGTITTYLTPTVVSLANWKQVSAGQYHTLAIDYYGRLWAWGSSAYRQLGTPSSSTVPILVSSDMDWMMAAAGGLHSKALKADGSLWSWGDNQFGEGGDGSPAFVGSMLTMPTRISIGPYTGPWVQISSTFHHAAAIRADGSLWTWGWNGSGQLGNGYQANKSSPILVGGDFDWAQVAAGYYHTLAIKNDGSLWGWGYNGSCALGQGIGSAGNYLVPVRIGTDSDWVQISAGAEFSLGVRSNGNVYVWGRNNWGQMGWNYPTNVCTPYSLFSLSAGDIWPPAVVSTSPANNATNVGLNSALSAIFNEPVDCALVSGSTMTVTTSPGGAVVGGTVTCSVKTVSFTPTAALQENTTHNVSIGGVRDLAGNVMPQPKSWSFKTGIPLPAAPSNAQTFNFYDPFFQEWNRGVQWRDNASNETGFEVQRTTTGTVCSDPRVSGWSTVGTESAVSGTGGLNDYIETSLQAGRTYCYRIKAVNNGGSSGWAYSNELVMP